MCTYLYIYLYARITLFTRDISEKICYFGGKKLMNSYQPSFVIFGNWVLIEDCLLIKDEDNLSQLL